MDTVSLIRERVDKLEAFFKENAYAMEHPHALQQMKFLCTSLCVGDSYIAEKAARISQLAERFYSTRKHQSHPGGADGIYAEIVHSLVPRIRQQASNIEYAQRNP
jgi:hypothetical protein